MKLKRLYVDNYRLFNKFEINFEVSPASCSTGIYGKNGTGKTTILKLIKLLTSTVHSYFNFLSSPGIDDKQKRFVLLYSLDEVYARLSNLLGDIHLELDFVNTKATDAKLIFKEGKIWLGNTPLNHILNKDMKHEFPQIVEQFNNFYFYPSIAQVQGDLFRFFPQPTSAASQEEKDKLPDSANVVDKLFPFLKQPEEAVNDLIRTRLFKAELENLTKQYTEEFNGKSNKFSTIKKYIDSFLDGKKLASAKDGYIWFNIKRANNTEDLVPLEDLSAGERHLITKILKLYLSECSNGVLLFDEPETSFHFEWQSKLIDILTNVPGCKNNQFIFTSHSRDLANSCDQFIYINYDKEKCSISLFDDSIEQVEESKLGSIDKNC